jgi:hypothetical protein
MRLYNSIQSLSPSKFILSSNRFAQLAQILPGPALAENAIKLGESSQFVAFFTAAGLWNISIGIFYDKLVKDDENLKGNRPFQFLISAFGALYALVGYYPSQLYPVILVGAVLKGSLVLNFFGNPANWNAKRLLGTVSCLLFGDLLWTIGFLDYYRQLL